jgi:SM-20-related protein
MWLNNEQVVDSAISAYRKSLLNSCPNHIVIDNLFDETKLDNVIQVLQQPHSWQTQRHTYSALYVDDSQWQKTHNDQRFVQRDVWQRDTALPHADNKADLNSNIADDFLSFLRSDEFMSVLSRIFNVKITDMNVADPAINTNYFRLNTADFVEQHADDSPGREVCMLLYLNKEWNNDTGGELVFIGKNDKPTSIAPLYNRCVLFDPSSEGSEHWVKKLNSKDADLYRYNVTSWYWSE